MSEPHPQDDILNRPVASGDLATELKANKRSMSKVTLGLAGAVVVVAAFFGGIATHSAIASGNSNNNAAANRPNGGGYGRFFGGPGNGQGGQNGQGNRGTVGTVERVEGTDVYIKRPDGSTVKVSTTGSTQIRVTKDGALSDLAQGQTVIVQGTAGQDGTVSAQTIIESPARQGSN